MSAVRPSVSGKVLAFSSVVEALTALALMADPAIVARLLLGAEVAGVGLVIGRCFGVALLGLGLACWPGGQRAAAGAAPLWGMGLYNALIAGYLAFLGTAGHFAAPLLWPAAVLHAVVALLLVWRRSPEANR